MMILVSMICAVSWCLALFVLVVLGNKSVHDFEDWCDWLITNHEQETFNQVMSILNEMHLDTSLYQKEDT